MMVVERKARVIKKGSVKPEDVMGRLRDALKKLVGREKWEIRTLPSGGIYEVNGLTRSECAMLDSLGVPVGSEGNALFGEAMLLKRLLPQWEAEIKAHGR